jgi:hypothetical protein
LITLHERFMILMPQRAWQFDSTTKRQSGKGLSQLAILNYGKGKLVVSGEAAMFTAQLSNGKPVGMNSKKAPYNYGLLLSLIHWLNTP